LSRKKTKILLIFFTLLTIASLIFLTYAFQIPTQETQTETLCTYTQDLTYDYTAKLQQPNYIYDNKSTIGPNDGPIYILITEHLNITFTYTFESTLTANTTIKYTTTGYIVTARWIKQNFTIPQKTVTNNSDTTTITAEITKIDVKSIQAFVAKINSEEIGVSTGNFNMTITTNIILTAETPAGTINEPFTATLNIAFLSGAPEGNIIQIQNLQTTKNGAITETQTITNDNAKTQQLASYGITAIAIGGLIISTFLHLKTKPPTPPSIAEELIKELREPYEDIIIEAAEEPPPRGQTTVIIKTLEDLVKIADMLTKPIIHYQKPPTPPTTEPTHTFYLLDANTRYEYNVTPSQLKTAKEHETIETEED
jgi:hypothetical protein